MSSSLSLGDPNTDKLEVQRLGVAMDSLLNKAVLFTQFMACDMDGLVFAPGERACLCEARLGVWVWRSGTAPRTLHPAPSRSVRD